MVDIPPLRSWEIISTEQKLSPALQELKKLVGPNNISVILEAYGKLSDSGKSSFFQMVQENNEGINTFIEIEDDVSLQQLLKKIITDTKVSETDTKVSETDTKVSETDTKVSETEMEKQKENNDRKKALTWAHEASRKAYGLFGDEAGFKTKFKDQIGEWTTKAAEAVGIDPEKANKWQLSDEEKTKLDVSLLVTNRDAIAAGLPEGKERTEFHKLAGELNSFARELKISVDKSPTQIVETERIKKQISTELIGLKSTDRVTQTGSEFRFGDQVIDISTRPPTRSIESNGIRVTFDKSESKERNYREQEKYRESRGDLTREIANLTKVIADGRGGMQEKYRILAQMKEDYKVCPEGSEEQKGLKVLIEKTEKELEDFKGKTERLVLLQSTLAVLDAAEALRANGYQESLASETEASRENLKYLESTHLTWLLGDSGIKLLIDQINAQKTILKPGSARLNLQTRFEDSDKKLFALGLKKLLWLDPKEMSSFFESNGYDMKQKTDPPISKMIKQKLESNGIYGGTPPTIHRENIQKVMSGTKKE